MNCNRVSRAIGLLAIAIVTLGIAACGGDEPTAATPPAPPPAPPPFQPQPVEVTLGELGGTVTLMTTDTGGFTLNGEAFEGGEVTAENGNTYALSLADGQWSAAYQAVTATLTLGITGEEVTLMRAEDGSYRIGDEAFEPGGSVAASNGNHYTLALAEDGSWNAAYLPATATATLGITGEQVTLTRAEDGSYRIGDAAFSSGGTVSATNGSEYTLTMADGTWTAAYVPVVQQVAVGNSGLSVPFTRQENGNWTAVHPTLGEQPVASGVQVPLGIEMYFVELLGDGTWRISYVPKMVPVALGISGQSVTLVKAENGTWSINGAPFTSGEGVAAGFGTYALTLGSGDTWTATFQEVPVTISLGTSGDMVTVVMVEDGSYTLDGDPFASGGEVTAGNGNVYRLALAEGAWSAMFVPMDVEIGGTGLTAMTREDQDGWDVNGARVPGSGTGDITVHGASYHVWHIDGDLFGARFDSAIHADSNSDSSVEVEVGLVGDFTTTEHRMTLSEDDEDTPGNELRTALSIAGQTFSISDLLGAGTATDSGDNFVAAARDAIETIRGDVAALLGLDTQPTGFTGLLEGRWTAIGTEIAKVFGSNPLSASAPDEDEILSEIDDILDALSSGTQLALATTEDGGGVFEDLALSEEDALDAFEANASESGIVFGSTGPTRYGAVSKMTRADAQADLGYAQGSESAVGAFSYSTIDDVQRIWDVATSGNAYYEGGTTAVSGDGTLYSGSIEIEIRFSSQRVSGLVTNLETAEGDPWQFQFAAVESIILAPATNLDNSAHWTEVDGSSDASARVTFERRAGSPSPVAVRGSFAGQLLGRDDESGDFAHGTWSIGTQSASGSASYLAGAFGAERVGDTSPVRPVTDDGSNHETAITSSDGLDPAPNSFALEGGNLVVTVGLGERQLEASASVTIGDSSADPSTERTVLGATAYSGRTAGLLDDAADLIQVDTDTTANGIQPATRELSVELAALVSSAGSEVSTNGPSSQVQLAIAEIELARADLAVLQALDTRIYTSERNAWRRVQEALLRIFHHVPPKLDGSYLDTNGDPTEVGDEALGLIDSVLNAFASSSNLKVAIDPDGSGIFNSVTKGDTADTSPSYGLIWDRQEVQLKSWADATDYTRFGAWRVQQDLYAASDGYYQPTESDANGNAPGVFAYSPLAGTQWSSDDDPSFPAGGTGRYVGKTVAIQGTTFLEGSVALLTEWNNTWSGNDPLGTLTMTISGLVNANGDPVTFGANAVEDITFTGVDITTGDDNLVMFSSAAVQATAYTGPLGTTANTLGADNGVEGKFVGQDVDGPFGVIGVYNIPDGLTNGRIQGAFGADKP